MPLYEYACRACGTRTERMRRTADRLDAPNCPECGARTALAMSAPGKVGSGVSGGGAESFAGGCGTGGCCGGACTPSLN
jgi:putative FmdB family regulatory protein